MISGLFAQSRLPTECSGGKCLTVPTTQINSASICLRYLFMGRPPQMPSDLSPEPCGSRWPRSGHIRHIRRWDAHNSDTLVGGQWRNWFKKMLALTHNAGDIRGATGSALYRGSCGCGSDDFDVVFRGHRLQQLKQLILF